MKSQRIPMTIKEYHLLEHPFGLKVEYWDGAAMITPRGHSVTTRLPLSHRNAEFTHSLSPIDPSRKQDMLAGYFDAFRDSVEFCDWPLADIQTHAEKNINDWLAGKRGEPHPASVMALTRDGDITELALCVLDCDARVNLGLLFVLPVWQRRKVATAMLTDVVNNLHQAGVSELFSTYQQAKKV